MGKLARCGLGYMLTFRCVDLQEADTSAGQLPENIGKNRYRDVLPYEVSDKVHGRTKIQITVKHLGH